MKSDQPYIYDSADQILNQSDLQSYGSMQMSVDDEMRDQIKNIYNEMKKNTSKHINSYQLSSNHKQGRIGQFRNKRLVINHEYPEKGNQKNA